MVDTAHDGDRLREAIARKKALAVIPKVRTRSRVIARDGGDECDGGEEDLGAPVVTGGNPAPVLQRNMISIRLRRL